MKTPLLVILFLLFGSYHVSAQNFQWVRVDSGYDYSGSYYGYIQPLLLDKNEFIHKITTIYSAKAFDSTTSTINSYYHPSLHTIYNSGGKIIRSQIIPGFVSSATIDKNSNLYCTGEFETKSDFDLGKATSILNPDGGTDAFIVKYDSLGKLRMALKIGGTGNDYGFEIKVDEDFNLLVKGSFNGTVDFDPGTATHKISGYGYFMLKLDSLGKFISVNINQSNDNKSITDIKGNIYKYGIFTGKVDFDPDPSKTFYLTSNGNYDAYIQKLDSKGKLIWTKSFGGKQSENLYSIAVDKWFNVYSTGIFWDSIDLDPGSNYHYLQSNGEKDVFMSKLDSLGNFVWGLQLGGPDTDESNLIAVDDSSNVYFAGIYQDSVDFDPSSNVYKLYGNPNSYLDLFILKLNSAGSFLWAKTFVNNNSKEFKRIHLDKKYNLYLDGYFRGTLDFNPDAAKYEKNSNYYYSPFLLKLGPCPSPTESTISGPSVLCGNERKGTYSVTQSAGAKGYIWRVPKGVKIDSGQSSNKIYVTFDSTFGEISVRPTNICDTNMYSYLTVKKQVTLPSVLAYSSSTKICKGDYVRLYTSGSASTYTWNKGVQNNANFYPDSTDNYIVTGTDKNGCSAKDTITVIVAAKSPTSIKGPTAICKNGKATYSVTTAKEAKGYFWTVPSDAKIDSGQNTSTIYVTFGSASGNISVIPNQSCTANPTVAYISVENINIGKSVSPSTSICKGASVTLSGSGAASYKWSGGVTNGVAFKPDSTTKYVLTATGNNGCILKDSVTINVGVSSPASINGPISVCNGESAIYSVVPVSGAKGYTWSVPNNTRIDSGQNTFTIYVKFGNISGNIGVIPTNACSSIKTEKYVAISNLSIGINVSPFTAIVCKGSPVILSATGGTNYSWSGGIKDGVSFIPDTTTTYTVTEKNVKGCIGQSSIIVKVNPLPKVGSTAFDSSICIGSGTALFGTGALTYQWSDGIINGVFFKPLTTKTYTVIGTDINGCTGSSSYKISVLKKPSITLQPKNQTEAVGNIVKFITSSSSTNATFQWQQNAGIGFMNLFDAGPYSGTNNDTLTIEQITLSQNNFKYRCITTDNGCIDTSQTATLYVKTGRILSSTIKQNLMVYPNPSAQYLTIESDEVLNQEPYSISDQVGKAILHGELNHKINTLDLSTLAAGFYVLKVGKEKSQMFKIQKIE